MIADCETCDRKQVPCKACPTSQRAICFVCQGDVADPYGEIAPALKPRPAPPFSDDLLIKAVRMTDLWGTCKCVKLMRDGKEIADSYWSMGEGVWYLGACGLETTLRVDRSKSHEENEAAVDAGLRALVARADALQSARAA